MSAHSFARYPVIFLYFYRACHRFSKYYLIKTWTLNDFVIPEFSLYVFWSDEPFQRIDMGHAIIMFPFKTAGKLYISRRILLWELIKYAENFVKSLLHDPSWSQSKKQKRKFWRYSCAWGIKYWKGIGRETFNWKLKLSLTLKFRRNRNRSVESRIPHVKVNPLDSTAFFSVIRYDSARLSKKPPVSALAPKWNSFVTRMAQVHTTFHEKIRLKHHSEFTWD